MVGGVDTVNQVQAAFEEAETLWEDGRLARSIM